MIGMASYVDVSLQGPERTSANQKATIFAANQLKIGYCLQELAPLAGMLRGEPVQDGTYIVQGSIVKALLTRGNCVTCVAPRNLEQVEYATDPQFPLVAPRTWTTSRGFDYFARGAWRIQQRVGLPYLNVFSNYRLYDACLQCLPGHDVVYERNGLYNVGVAMACKKLELPYVVFFEADQIMELEFMGKPLTGLLRYRAEQILRYNLNAADCIITVSEPAKTNLVQTWKVPPDKVLVFSNGVDIERFRPLSSQDKRRVRAEMELSDGPLVAFTGSFFEWHDVGTLLDSFGGVLERHPSAQLVLIGEGRLRSAMMERATALGLGTAAHFPGLLPQHRVAALLGAADVAVAPYPVMTRELWLSPLKLFEYMASGTAIIASRVGQVAQIIQDGKNGLLVEPGNPAALTDALNTLLGDPDLRVRLGSRARNDAVQNHSWDQYVTRLEGVFRRVISARQAQSG